MITQLLKERRNELNENDQRFDSESNSKLRNGIYVLKNQFNSYLMKIIYSGFHANFLVRPKDSRSNSDIWNSLKAISANLYEYAIKLAILRKSIRTTKITFFNNSISYLLYC